MQLLNSRRALLTKLPVRTRPSDFVDGRNVLIDDWLVDQRP